LENVPEEQLRQRKPSTEETNVSPEVDELKVPGTQTTHSLTTSTNDLDCTFDTSSPTIHSLIPALHEYVVPS
jgi:hypothetical protein